MAAIGNYVDWMGTGNEPAIGTTYSPLDLCEAEMAKGTTTSTAGGLASRVSRRRTNTYLVTAVSASGETEYASGYVVSRQTGAGDQPYHGGP